MTQPQPTRAPVLVTDRGLAFGDLAGLWEVATMVANSGLAPRNLQKPEAIAVAMVMGGEVGLSPMQSLQQIAVINGRPSIWGDAALALVKGHPSCADVAEGLELVHESGQIESDPVLPADRNKWPDSLRGWCEVIREGDQQPCRRTFSVADAKRGGLWNKKDCPWVTYPQRMLVLRARSWALRDKFPDVLRGVGIAEEVRDIPPEDYEIREPVIDPTALPSGGNGSSDDDGDRVVTVVEEGAAEPLPTFGR